MNTSCVKGKNVVKEKVQSDELYIYVHVYIHCMYVCVCVREREGGRTIQVVFAGLNECEDAQSAWGSIVHVDYEAKSTNPLEVHAARTRHTHLEELVVVGLLLFRCNYIGT